MADESFLKSNLDTVNNINDILKKEYVGDAGAGMVRVTITADIRIKKIEIDHTMFAKTVPEIINDLDFLADLFKAAMNQAIEKSNVDLIHNYSNFQNR